jgi:hypothetical protein
MKSEGRLKSMLIQTMQVGRNEGKKPRGEDPCSMQKLQVKTNGDMELWASYIRR